jgi:endonuclease YncB( thermonuclease family)
MKRLSLILLLFSCTSRPKDNGTVTRVKDGDTVVILTKENKKLNCRLYGIDAPEKKQPFGIEAKEYLSDRILDKVVDYKVKSIDHYGRSVCLIYEGSGYSVNEEMVLKGFAWAYVQYLKKDKEELRTYLRHQSFAFIQRDGLWQDSDPEAPWIYRKKRRKSQ